MNALPDYEQALRIALQGVPALRRLEHIELARCSGRILAEPILADRDLPPFNRAQMDGYAIRAGDFKPGLEWRVVHSIAAGTSADVKVADGQCVAIATGAPLPESLDTVIQHELSNRGETDGRGAVRFTVQAVTRGQAVHARGADATSGDQLVPAKTALGAHHIAIAAAVGRTTLTVRSRPRVRVLTSGDEVMRPDTPTVQLAPYQIRNSNSPMLADLINRFGAEFVGSSHVRDDREATIKEVRSAMAGSDLLITVGGVSAGDRDHFPAAFGACGIQPVLRGASIQPGRPIQVASNQQPIVVALPGNPVSALACACLFVWPIVRAMLGVDPALPWRNVALLEPVKPNHHRRAFRPAMLKSPCEIAIPSWAGSGDLAHTASTHGLAELPVQDEPVIAGTQLRFLPWP